MFLDASSHLYKRVRPSVGPSVRPSVGRSVTLSWKVEKCNIYSAKYMAKLIWYVWCAFPHLYDRICPSVGLSVKISDSLSSSLSLLSPRTHPWPLGLVPVIVCISLPSIIARIMVSNRSFITCLLFCHYWESMKRLQRISAISAKYSGSREIRSSEVLLYLLAFSCCFHYKACQYETIMNHW